jgi:hypothetical protein
MRTAILSLLATACSPWVSVPPERAQPSELVVLNPSPNDAPFVMYRAWFPAGVAVEPTASPGLAQTTARALSETLKTLLPTPEQSTHTIFVQVDLDWVSLGLKCAVEQEPLCTDAWTGIVNLATPPKDVVDRVLSMHPDITEPEPSALDWLEALLFDGHRYGRDLSLGCTQCSHDDVTQYYAATFRSEWTRWGVSGAFPRASVDQIDRVLSEQDGSAAPTMNRFSPPTWKQTRVAILPSHAPERSLILGNTNPLSWGEFPEGSAPRSLPRRWAMVHQAPFIPPQTNVVEMLKIGLEATNEATSPTPQEPQIHDPLTTALVQSLPSRFPESILGPRSTEASAWTFVLSSSTPDQDLEELQIAMAKGVLSPVEAWVLEVPPRAPSPPHQDEASAPTESPSTTKPGASM